MIQTAEEFLISQGDKDFRLSMSGFFVSDVMIEFAKLHVRAALEAASKQGRMINDPNSYTGNTGSEYPPDVIIDNNSILNAYPDELVK